ncbi:carboxylesterase/lipase family protein [Gordonia liuliyuniae]|uniref:Carboxylic ester hydrolase n=1 Tax=Gordonia liuliyuniae TaxID=2911517 RepID=A0ABS9IWU0_9ACTN|nr:carboxylesterase/lipase family protein [Gordonia liuliyuniae]MCF8590044.1 carboxylesterase/lipase family protein [Gordonia liuliyuniae]
MDASLEVSTAEGVVRGRRSGDVNRWLGIPYASPPVGRWRFRAPQPVQPWSGVRDGTTYGDAAVQHASGSRAGAFVIQPQSEDCLTINVTAPANSSGELRPVMVFIHGGGYFFGCSAMDMYHGNNLAARGDVVFVSLNYRLNAFGYIDFTPFATADGPIDSNLGVRDQVAALQWVQRNIAAFGGDPDNVTIFGESAGGAAVTTLFATPAADGLFHRGIAQSAPVDWAHDADTAADIARGCIAALGIRVGEAAETLRFAPPQRLRRAVSEVARGRLVNKPGEWTLAPVVDGDYLPSHPFDAFADGTAHRVPLIIGRNRNEGSFFSKVLDAIPTTDAKLRRMFATSDSVPLDSIAKHYTEYSPKRAAVCMGADYTFLRPLVATVEGHSRYAPTYTYRYDFAPRTLNLLGFGATHTSEMIAVFGLDRSPAGWALTALGGRKNLRAVTEQVQGHWINIAHHGEPLSSWPRYTATERDTLVFDTHTRVVEDPERDRRLAWATYPRMYSPREGSE